MPGSRDRRSNADIPGDKGLMEWRSYTAQQLVEGVNGWPKGK
jgi:hypothetical protein